MVASAAAQAAGPAIAALNDMASSASTRPGSVATTVAVRGTSRSSAISPTPSPGPQVRSGLPCAETSTVPVSITR